jgi:hypothetical protein
MGRSHLVVAAFQEIGVQFVSDHRTAQRLAQAAGAARVVVVTVREQQVLDLLGEHPDRGEMIEQPPLTPTSAGIHQRGATVEVDQVNGGILGGGQTGAAHLENFAGDGHGLRHHGVRFCRWVQAGFGVDDSRTGPLSETP